MNRRQALAVVAGCGIASIAGCLGGDDPLETAGDDDDPFDVPAESLLLSPGTVESTLGGGWDRSDDPDDERMFSDADAAQEVVPWDTETGDLRNEDGRISTGVWLHDAVADARTAFEESPYQEGYGFEEYPIAVECIGGPFEDQHHDRVRVLFRDANAIGGISYRNRHVSPAVRLERGLEVAAAMHVAWRE